MLKSKIDKNQKFNVTLWVQTLFYTFPLSFMLGNLILTMNTLLFIIISLFLIKAKKLNFRITVSHWILICFFLYLFLSTTIQFQIPGKLYDVTESWKLINKPFFKSFSLIRFVILVFVIDTLLFNKILDIKKFFLSSLICTVFVSIDVIFQYLMGFDVLGFKVSEQFPTIHSGPFGDEGIAGSYLTKFSFISIFCAFIILKDKNFSKLLLILFIVLHATAILFSGNRMPMLLFLFGMIIAILLIKNIRFLMSWSLIVFLSLFYVVSQNDLTINNPFKIFKGKINLERFSEISKNVEIITNKDELSENEKWGENLLRQSGHGALFRTAGKVWLDKPLIGSGLKSFRVKCQTFAVPKELSSDLIDMGLEVKNTPWLPLGCSNHPHNYYFELLSKSGIIGTSLMIILFLILIKDSFYYIKKNNQQINSEIIFMMPVIISVFLEIWPIRSSGSFFTTGSATFFWLMVGILLSAKVQNHNNKS